jgi:hypothetical protein
VKAPLKEIEFGDRDRYIANPTPLNSNGTMNGDRHDYWFTTMSHAVEQLREEGKKFVTKAELWDVTQGLIGPDKGINNSAASSALVRLGVKKGGTQRMAGYVLSPDDEDSGRIVRDAEELIRNARDVAVPV